MTGDRPRVLAGLKRGSLAACRALAVIYPIALVVVIACLRLVGERWWVTTVALYLPRWVFALPLVPLTAFLLWCGPRRLLWGQLAALVLLWSPLLGFHFSWPRAPVEGDLRLRLVSCNVNAGASASSESILDMLRSSGADVIVLQSVHPNQYAALQAGLPGYASRVSGQFLIASRFPVSEVFEPPLIVQRGVPHLARFARFTIETPNGPVIVYDIHPISPRDGLEELRGQGIRTGLLRGNLFNPSSRATIASNTELRLAQVRALAADARQARHPTIIAGDTNLPELSWAFANLLGVYQEGFSAVGTGFGYTFPAPEHPWMRIDRVLAGPHWQFLDFHVIRAAISDHFAVAADLQLRSELSARTASSRP